MHVNLASVVSSLLTLMLVGGVILSVIRIIGRYRKVDQRVSALEQNVDSLEANRKP